MPEKLSFRIYAGIFFVFLLLFLLAGFPSDSIERRVVFEIQSSSPVPVLVGDAELRGFSSIELRDVRVMTGEADPLAIDRVRISAALFSAVFSDGIEVSFSADAYGGNIDGMVLLSAEENGVLSAEADISSLESSGVSRVFLGDGGVSVSGKIDGNVKFFGDGTAEGISKMEYMLSSPSLSVSVDKVHGFDIKEKYADLGVLLRGTANRFESRVERFSLANPKLSLQAEGKAPSPLRLKKGAAIDLTVAFKPSPQDVKLLFVGALLGTPSDGTFSGKIQGTLAEPRIVRGGGGS